MKELSGVCLGFVAAIVLTVTVTGSFEPSEDGDKAIATAPQIATTVISSAD